MATFNFDQFFQSLADMGVMEFLVFLLIFTIIFAVLEKTRIMGEAKRNLNVGVSLIIALIVLIGHATNRLGAYDPVNIIINALPQVSLVVVAIIMLMILIGVFAHDRIMLGMTAPGWIGLFSVAAIIYIFGSAAGWWAGGVMNWMEGTFGQDVLAVVIMILVFGIIIAFVTGGQEREQLGAFKRMGLNFDKLFGGGK